uniref:Uncharacterized protein n=1 Tax=Triticum urartu TaxID=4572 RepID=A0A8R7TVS3_TRIUA
MALAGPPRRLRVVHAVSQSATRGHASGLPVALANPPRSLHVVPVVSPILNQGTRQESSVTRPPHRRSSISGCCQEFHHTHYFPTEVVSASTLQPCTSVVTYISSMRSCFSMPHEDAVITSLSSLQVFLIVMLTP